ncbi:hypothetical protein CCACVL1_29083 [Corchorus capsularis]|uniref:Uncharacterized protein n=1 Tax=Corchorus capsularis TaxID=210143 RepID=A0A1R3G3Z6_COCAP|nr:hypothetical protein CCACVL1_29083 [Corchorus capsularis]
MGHEKPAGSTILSESKRVNCLNGLMTNPDRFHTQVKRSNNQAGLEPKSPNSFINSDLVIPTPRGYDDEIRSPFYGHHIIGLETRIAKSKITT